MMVQRFWVHCVVHASDSLQEASSDFRKFGIRVDGVSVDIPAMQSYKDKIVGGLTQGIEGLFKRNKVEYIKVNTLLMHACMYECTCAGIYMPGLQHTPTLNCGS